MEEKRYLIHTDVFVTGEPMQCIYLSYDQCMAEPLRKAGRSAYKPTVEEQDEFCKTSEFKKCPRFTAYQDHLEKAGIK